MAKVAKETKKSTSGSKKKDAAKAAHLESSERWTEDPAEHDYPAAASFLSLICEPTEVRKLVTALKAAPIVRHQAKDLLRASGLALLPLDNVHVASDLAKVDRGEPLSPVLLVRGDVRRGVALTIADGYHRVCASYHLDENAEIPCHLIDYKGPSPVPAFRQRSASNSGGSSRASASSRGSGSPPAPAPAPASASAPPAAPPPAPPPPPASALAEPPAGAPLPSAGSVATPGVVDPTGGRSPLGGGDVPTHTGDH